VGGESVWEKIATTLNNSGANDLLVRHSLFDTFKKDGRISYAFRLIFQSMEKTLTDTEINAIMEKIGSDIKATGWEVR
jgi:phenylalanyl-tRNA synthetase beta subunit